MLKDYIDYLGKVDLSLRQEGLKLPLRLDCDTHNVYSEINKLEQFVYFNHVLGVSGSSSVLPLGGKTLEDYNRDRLYEAYESEWQAELVNLTADLERSEPVVKQFTLQDSNLYNESLGLVSRQQDFSEGNDKNTSLLFPNRQDTSTISSSEILSESIGVFDGTSDSDSRFVYEFDEDEAEDFEEDDEAYEDVSTNYYEFDDDGEEEPVYEDVSSNYYEFDEDEEEEPEYEDLTQSSETDDEEPEYEDLSSNGYEFDDDEEEEAEYEDVTSDEYSFDEDDEAEEEYEDVSSESPGVLDISAFLDNDIETEAEPADEDDEFEPEYEDLTVTEPQDVSSFIDDEEDDGEEPEYEDLTSYAVEEPVYEDEDDEFEPEYEDLSSAPSDISAFLDEAEEEEEPEYEDLTSYDNVTEDDEDDEEYEDVYEDVVPEGYSDEDDDEEPEYEDLTSYDDTPEDDEDDEEYEDVYEDVSSGSEGDESYDDEDEEYEDVYEDVDEFSDEAVLGGIDVASIVDDIESGKYDAVTEPVVVSTPVELPKSKENPFIHADRQAESVKSGVNTALSGIFNKLTNRRG